MRRYDQNSEQLSCCFHFTRISAFLIFSHLLHTKFENVLSIKFVVFINKKLQKKISNLYELSTRSYKCFGSLFHIKWPFFGQKTFIKKYFFKFKNSQILNKGFESGLLPNQKEKNQINQTKDPLAIQNSDFSNPKSL